MSERLFDDKVFDATWNMIGPDGHCIPWWDIAKNEIKDFIDAEIRRNTAKLEAELAEAKERIKTTAKNGIACVIASEDKLAAQAVLISRMREALDQIAAGTYSSFDVDYKSIAKEMMRLAQKALSESAAEPAPEGKK